MHISAKSLTSHLKFLMKVRFLVGGKSSTFTTTKTLRKKLLVPEQKESMIQLAEGIIYSKGWDIIHIQSSVRIVIKIIIYGDQSG